MHSSHRVWPLKRTCPVSPASAACAGSTGVGSIQAGLERIVELKERARRQAGRGPDSPRHHLADRAPLRSALPMTDLRLMPPLGRENDVGGRFTVCPVPGFTRDPPRIRRGGSVLRLRGPAGRGQTGRSGGDGSDPPGRWPATGAGPGVFSHAGPRPPGVAPSPWIPWREGRPAPL